MSPVLSFIIPVYNVEAYLRTCINSILEQSGMDCEVILVDDGSTDGWTRLDVVLYIYFAIIFAVSMRISHKYRGVISGLMCAGLLILDGKFD